VELGLTDRHAPRRRKIDLDLDLDLDLEHAQGPSSRGGALTTRTSAMLVALVRRCG